MLKENLSISCLFDVRTPTQPQLFANQKKEFL